MPNTKDQDQEQETTGTHKANQFNSTDFTDCCGLAVLKEETECPGCKAIVTIRSK